MAEIRICDCCRKEISNTERRIVRCTNNNYLKIWQKDICMHCALKVEKFINMIRKSQENDNDNS